MATFVCSDVHGNFDAWQKAIEKSDLDLDSGDKLIILGDLIDRGEKSYDCLRHTFELIDTYSNQVVYLIGNHEEMFLNFLAVENLESEEGYKQLVDIGEVWLKYGGKETVMSLLGNSATKYFDDLITLQTVLIEEAPFISKLQSLPHYYVDEKYDLVYVHAGFQSGVRLKEQKPESMLWIREQFYNHFEPVEGDVLENKLIIHGHTPVVRFKDYNGEGFYQGKHHLCIDGGAALNRKILILKVDDFSYVEQSV